MYPPRVNEPGGGVPTSIAASAVSAAESKSKSVLPESAGTLFGLFGTLSTRVDTVFTAGWTLGAAGVASYFALFTGGFAGFYVLNEQAKKQAELAKKQTSKIMKILRTRF